MEFKIAPQLAQKLNLTPQMLQTIGLMSLNVVELEKVVQHELTENPVLEEKGETLEDLTPLEEQEKEFLEWTQYTATNIQSVSSKEEHPEKFYERHTPVTENLKDHLIEQINYSGFSAEEEKILYQLVNELDDNGYLTANPQELSKKWNVDLKLLKELIKDIHELDPPGVGARDTKECIYLQALRVPENEHMLKIIDFHWQYFSHHQYSKIAQAMNLPVEKIKEVAKRITMLSPDPGQSFNTEPTEYVVPDIRIQKKEDGTYEAVLNEDNIPQINISSQYSRFLNDMRKKSKDVEAQKYLIEKMKKALTFIRALNQRKQSLALIGDLIVSEQSLFFEKGVRFLHPLLLKEAAERLGVHISTVSRLTTNKYIHTPQGVFELKYFFGTSYLNKKGERLSVHLVRLLIKDIIQNEKEILSDMSIAEFLKEKEGLELSRKQVARLREEVGLPNASARKIIKGEMNV